MITQSLFLSPAVFSEDRVKFFIDPWIQLAKELGFEKLYTVLSQYNVLEIYKKND